MNVLLLARKIVIQNLKRPVTLGLLIVAPLLVILILGTALDGVWSGGQTFDTLSIAYLVEHQGPLSSAFLGFADSAPSMSATRVDSSDVGLVAVRAGDYDALVVLDETTLRVVINDDAGVRAGVITGLIRGFARRYDLFNLVGPVAVADVLQTDAVSVQTLSRINQPRALDFFGINILVILILWGSFVGAFGLIGERENGTLDRMLVSPTPRMTIFAGICLGSFVSLILQMAAVFVVGRYGLGVRFGNAPWRPGLVLASEALFSLALGISLASLIRDGKAVSGALNLLVPLLILLGGGYVPLPDLPLFRILSKASPVSWVQNALIRDIHAADPSGIFPAILVCLGAGVFLLVAAAILASRREVW